MVPSETSKFEQMWKIDLKRIIVQKNDFVLIVTSSKTNSDRQNPARQTAQQKQGLVAQ